jgi:hypothetical protein
MKHYKDKDYERGVKHGNEGKYAHPPNIMDNLGGESYVKGKEFAYRQRINNPKKEKKDRKSSDGVSSGGYSGSTGGYSVGGGGASGGLGIVLLLIIITGLITVFHTRTPSVAPVVNNDNTPQMSNVSSYYEENFSVSADKAIVDGDNTIVNVKLTNLSEIKSKVLISSGQSITTLGQEQFVSRPFLRDESGNEYLVRQPAIQGEAGAYIFDDAQWGGVSTIKIGLPPKTEVSGRMIFPRLRDGMRKVTLVIPGVSGWQSDIVIPGITVSTISTGQEFSGTQSQDQIRTSEDLSSGAVNQGLTITQAGVAEELNSDGNPVGENTVFHGNGRYDRSRRDYIIYHAKYSGAIPERTIFKTKIFYNGVEDLFMHHGETIIAKNSNGTYSCRPGPYDLAAGEWEIRLFANDQEVNRTKFKIVSGQ